ncbi:23S rRNA (adenine(2503)-C(2))-methyltransferase RlmN [Thermodesulforhabdus norvegica]|uniref:Probable dual-specificity RNA methyltransferase RlmN n=1 Tax=Thermodesulforhabdus norvegica TaxID=39841 RepID=A0A1I4U9I9_9BACT|nr:23S rRNA (adenine(2503)-C(2))-methyltransferase RlmN [Thermodesulforhabdus norvegica]SFM85617.1 23S rRNA m(2)A-2503 methyltransferase [Thermodesulforhabdus norvegica]
MKAEKLHLRNFTPGELEGWIESLGEKKFRARQIFRHLHKRHVDSWDTCTDLSLDLRRRLQNLSTLTALELKKHMVSRDGTERFVFALADSETTGLGIETVMIPDPPRYTVCVSTQVGCPLGCAFCYTGKIGFKRNLTAGEIVEQISLVQRRIGSKRRITNVVFMGMGEPLLNERELFRSLEILLDPQGFSLSHRRITVSTVGIIPAMERLGKSYPVNLAVSLHATSDDVRSRIMPINRTYPLEQLLRACKRYPLPPRKRITFEYILLDGINDSESDALALSEMLKDLRCKVNLIPYNPFPGSPFKRPDDRKIERFQNILLDRYITATTRESRGLDIGAACGQLVGSLENAEESEYGKAGFC